MKKIIKNYIIYALIIAVIYLGLPIFLHSNESFHPFMYQFAFPATALITGLAYSWKRGVDFTFPLIAPLIYLGSVFIFNHLYHWAIYVFIYLIVGMLGGFIGDMVYKNNIEQKKREKRAKKLENDNYKITITNITVEKENEEKTAEE